jgi:hypothetical protein
MDIQGNHSGPDGPMSAYEQRQRALIDANRALVRAAREDLSAVARERASRARENRTRQDEIELSAAARAVSEPSPAEREARVRELAEAHRMERLHTPERIERAAQRLLEG